MEIKDVELATGLSENTIHFYESEGLITIKRNSLMYIRRKNERVGK